MAGDRVYKLKRPRHLGFVDFRSLAAREEALRQELRLNRRTAAALYLGLRPVLDSPAGVCLGNASIAPSTPVLDWALEMQRFDDRQGLDHLADRGELTPSMVEALASAIASFHAGLPPSTQHHLGSAELTGQWARDNLIELRTLLAGSGLPARQAEEWADRCDQLLAWTEARGAALAPAMAARHAAGWVREGHGDLHLANVVWHEGAPLLFDALEFSAELRHIDTVGDWSFTFMDLLARTGPDLAWRFASTLVESANDHGALVLLRWWAVYRALVRAKVARLGPTGALSEAEFQRCWAVAEGLAAEQPLEGMPQPPWLVLVMGLSGSGKSRVAQGLLGQLKAVRLRSDVERKRLFGLAPLQRPDASLRVQLYRPESTRRTYDRLHRLATTILGAGVGVVVDAASLRRDERLAFVDLARALGARHVLLCCEAPQAVLQRRLAARASAGNDPSDADVDVLALQQRVAEWPGQDEAAWCWRLSTDGLPHQVDARARALPWQEVPVLAGPR